MPQYQHTITETTPIVGVIEVIQAGPTGVTAIVDGQRQAFPDLDAVFRAAVRLLDEKTPPHTRPARPFDRPCRALPREKKGTHRDTTDVLEPIPGWSRGDSR